MKTFRLKSNSKCPDEIRIALSVYEAMRASIGTRRAETGGMLGGDFKTGTITHFYYDENASRSFVTYSPDVKTVNRVLSEDWNPAEIRLLGFAHSHPVGLFQPSGGDETYAERILAQNEEIPFLALPIIQSAPDAGNFQMRMFLAQRKGKGVEIQRVKFVIFEDEERAQPGDKAVETRKNGDGTLNEPEKLPAAEKPAEAGHIAAPRPAGKMWPHIYAAHQPLIQAATPFCATPSAPQSNDTFKRVRGAYDVERLGRCRVIYVAVGGAAGFAEDMARAGLGEHVIVEPDVVAESNLATQQTYRRDIGRAKADCVAERIRDINPSAHVVPRQQFLDDIDDEEFRRLAFEAFPGRPAPERVVVCGFTDAFSPQARVNRLGLKFGIPTLCAQVYREGRAAELTFTFPGITPACGRCILSERYKAYENGYKNDVTSDGTPIFATTRLNAIKGFVMMAILHHGTGHPRWGSLLQRIGNRNLIQVRLDPDVESTIGVRNFSEAFRGADPAQIFFDEAIWRPQLQECPGTGYPTPCPDCGGTGDLRDAIGKFTDTRAQ